jgi:RNA polymerase sigma-70 factor (ECF subfamily)
MGHHASALVKAEDYDLLAAWRSGDQRAGSHLFRRHFSSVHRFFRSKLPGEADDLTQRTFLACVESRDTIRPELRFKSYLFGIARHRLLTFIRDQKPGASLDAHLLCAADLKDSPESDSARREERRLVLASMRRIPLDYQIALEMFYWENMSVEEIAAVLGTPLGTIKSRLSRGRTLLRDQVIAMDAAPCLTQSTLRYLGEWLRSLGRLAPSPPGSSVL